MHTYYLHLGSNKGDRTSYLSNAIKQITAKIGQVTDQSAIYQTEPWGKKDQDDFLNMAIKVESNLVLEDALNAAKKIETDMGSEKKEKWGPRIPEDRHFTAYRDIAELHDTKYDGRAHWGKNYEHIFLKQRGSAPEYAK